MANAEDGPANDQKNLEDYTWSERAINLRSVSNGTGNGKWREFLNSSPLEAILTGIQFQGSDATYKVSGSKWPKLRDNRKTPNGIGAAYIAYYALMIYGAAKNIGFSDENNKKALNWGKTVTEEELKQLKAAALQTLKEDAKAVVESVKNDGFPEDDNGKVKEFSGQRGNLLSDQKVEQFVELVVPFYLDGSSDALIEKLEKLADEESANVAAESNDGGTTSQGATNSQSGGSAKKTNRPTDEGAEKPKSGDDRKQTNQPASSPNPEGGARSAAQTDALVAQYAKTKEQLRNQQATGRELAVLRNTLRYLFESLERVLTRAELEERLNSPHDDEGVESA